MTRYQLNYSYIYELKNGIKISVPFAIASKTSEYLIIKLSKSV